MIAQLSPAVLSAGPAHESPAGFAALARLSTPALQAAQKISIATADLFYTLRTNIVPPPPFVPSADFSDPRNSQYSQTLF